MVRGRGVVQCYPGEVPEEGLTHSCIHLSIKQAFLSLPTSHSAGHGGTEMNPTCPWRTPSEWGTAGPNKSPSHTVVNRVWTRAGKPRPRCLAGGQKDWAGCTVMPLILISSWVYGDSPRGGAHEEHPEEPGDTREDLCGTRCGLRCWSDIQGDFPEK